jgi:hypothetical protein
MQLALQQGTPPFFYMRDDVWGNDDEPHSTVQLTLHRFLYGHFFGTEGKHLNIV